MPYSNTWARAQELARPLAAGVEYHTWRMWDFRDPLYRRFISDWQELQLGGDYAPGDSFKTLGLIMPDCDEMQLWMRFQLSARPELQGKLPVRLLAESEWGGSPLVARSKEHLHLHGRPAPILQLATHVPNPLPASVTAASEPAYCQIGPALLGMGVTRPSGDGPGVLVTGNYLSGIPPDVGGEIEMGQRRDGNEQVIELHIIAPDAWEAADATEGVGPLN